MALISTIELSGTPRFKWLNLRKLAEVLFPQDTIHQICYFTALLNARADDPTRRRRQLVYLRAFGDITRL